MKYMHFKASCSYAGLANMMEMLGVDTEDYKIAMEMGLPWLFAEEDGEFFSGPMLQNAQWFNLWLCPRGFAMEETTVGVEELCNQLQSRGPSMLGIETPYGKHAVIFTGYDGNYHFINPTYEGSGEVTELSLCEAELLHNVEKTIVIARISPREPKTIDMRPFLARSIYVLRENVAEIDSFATVSHGPNEYICALNRLFRPLFLDGISMLELVGETNLAESLRVLQGQLMEFMRGSRDRALSSTLSLEALHDAANEYVRLIEKAFIEV